MPLFGYRMPWDEVRRHDFELEFIYAVRGEALDKKTTIAKGPTHKNPFRNVPPGTGGYEPIPLTPPTPGEPKSPPVPAGLLPPPPLPPPPPPAQASSGTNQMKLAAVIATVVIVGSGVALLGAAAFVMRRR